ncbi:MAG: hypothetical protein H7240_01245 [Glaciimonas sp.]|nr:hypothetical protein [Glaciimonas sp.]
MASRAQILFPGYIYTRFTAEVYSAEHGYKIPDFALIEQGYRRWYIGEVERAQHPLHSHVLPQVHTFREGEYGPSHVKSVLKYTPSLDEERLKLLFANTPPTVIVVVNRPNQVWAEAMHSSNALLSIFEIFRLGDSAEFVFRINGDNVNTFDTQLSYCVVDESFKQAIRVLTPAAVPFSDGSKIPVVYNGIESEWVFRIFGLKGWLIPVNKSDFPPEKNFSLNLGQEQRLHLISTPNAAQRRN